MEMERIYVLALIAATIEATVCLIGTRELLRFPASGTDRSRRLLIMGSSICGGLALVPILAAAGFFPEQTDFSMLNPWLGLIYMSLHIIMTLYPISVISPGWFNPKRFFFVFLPVAVFFIALLIIGEDWTRVYTPMEIWENVHKPDIVVRLAMLFVMVPYCLIIVVLNYNYRKTSASYNWILTYFIALFMLCGVHVLYMLSNDPRLVILLAIFASLFYLFSIEFELKDRLTPGDEEAEDAPEAAPKAVPEPVPADLPAEFGLWTRVGIVMDQEEAWRDPDLSLGELAKRCGTNTTYLVQIIRGETGDTFKTFVNAKRIDYVTRQLREHPGLDIQTAFFNAGYRSRATAWRNFKEIVGVTPTEYRQQLFP